MQFDRRGLNAGNLSGDARWPVPEPVTIEPLVYGVTDFAIALGGKSKPLSERTIYRLLDKGEIPKPIKLGRRIVWPVEAIKAWLAAGAPTAAEWDGMNSKKTRRRAG